MNIPDNPGLSTDEFMKQLFESLADETYIHASEFPDIDLYIDQITTFMEGHLSHTRRNDSDKILTKTMINNYTKNHLLPPPQKKKYSKKHMLLMVFIYYLKGFLSISDIQKLLAPLGDDFFAADSVTALSDIYEKLFCTQESRNTAFSARMEEDFKAACQLFEADHTADEETRRYLQMFAFIYMESMEICMRKQMIEHILDTSDIFDKK